jgi:hypothetical protein
MSRLEIVPRVGETKVVKVEHFLNFKKAGHLLCLALVFLLDALQLKFSLLKNTKKTVKIALKNSNNYHSLTFRNYESSDWLKNVFRTG